ncbi:MAG TPA: hypothetical protein VF094_00935 [Gaiellaceae bacterium]
MVRTIVGVLTALAVAALFAGTGGATGNGRTSSSTAASGSTGGGCIAHRPAYIEDVFEVAYAAGCSGHDEPELDPVSGAAGSAKDLTWTFVLPTDGIVPVSAVGPAFWFGGVVGPDLTSFGGQDFLEVQFYPDSLVKNCNPNGAYVVSYAPNTYTVCSPVWSIHTTGQKPNFHEPAAFNAMLTNGSSKKAPLVMHAGDTITIHFHVVSTHEGWHIDVADLTTGGTGTIVLDSAQGPLLPVFDTQTIGNALSWGAVYDTPNSFVWEIGHTSSFSSPAAKFCLPGNPVCDSYNADSWAGFSPIQIKSVTFGDGSSPTSWAVVSDFGGNAEVEQSCGTVGGPFCIYPWFSFGRNGFHYGVDYPDAPEDFGQGSQFPTTTQCDSAAFGPDSLYCAHVVK